MATGCLYVCATPIGNLEDVTLRVLRVLGEVDLVAAEDTRRTRRLLTHYEIATPLISLHEHNETARAERLVERLVRGESIALVSDAGMPAISDPGARLIRAVIDADVPLTVLPGPSAFVTALVGSGLPAERFAFEGFLPRSPRRRRAWLRDLKDEPRTLVFYEAPHRVKQTVVDMMTELGDRSACIARELTKAFEQWQRAPLSQLAASWTGQAPRGEYVLIVEGASKSPRVAVATGGVEDGGEGSEAAPTSVTSVTSTTSAADAEPPTAEELVRHVTDAMATGLDKKSAIQHVARQLALPRRVVYQAAIAIDVR